MDNVFLPGLDYEGLDEIEWGESSESDIESNPYLELKQGKGTHQRLENSQVFSEKSSSGIGKNEGNTLKTLLNTKQLFDAPGTELKNSISSNEKLSFVVFSLENSIKQSEEEDLGKFREKTAELVKALAEEEKKKNKNILERKKIEIGEKLEIANEFFEIEENGKSPIQIKEFSQKILKMYEIMENIEENIGKGFDVMEKDKGNLRFLMERKLSQKENALEVLGKRVQNGQKFNKMWIILLEKQEKQLTEGFYKKFQEIAQEKEFDKNLYSRLQKETLEHTNETVIKIDSVSYLQKKILYNSKMDKKNFDEKMRIYDDKLKFIEKHIRRNQILLEPHHAEVEKLKRKLMEIQNNIRFDENVWNEKKKSVEEIERSLLEDQAETNELRKTVKVLENECTDYKAKISYFNNQILFKYKKIQEFRQGMLKELTTISLKENEIYQLCENAKKELASVNVEVKEYNNYVKTLDEIQSTILNDLLEGDSQLLYRS